MESTFFFMNHHCGETGQLNKVKQRWRTLQFEGHTRARVHTRTYAHTCVHTHTHICMHACTHTCTQTCPISHTHARTHTHTHTHTKSWIPYAHIALCCFIWMIKVLRAITMWMLISEHQEAAEDSLWKLTCQHHGPPCWPYAAAGQLWHPQTPPAPGIGRAGNYYAWIFVNKYCENYGPSFKKKKKKSLHFWFTCEMFILF